jgi:hypothetical protein
MAEETTMKKMIIALALTATTALLAHESYSVRVVHSEVPRKVICTQPRIVHVEPARVYYGWNDRRYDRDYYRGHERHDNDNRHDHR